MKIFTRFFIIALFAIPGLLIAQLPTVTFTATPASICACGSVTFINTTTNFPTSWTWYFPGGNPSFTVGVGSAGNPATPIGYCTPGSYPVICVVANSSGRDSVTIDSCVTVKPLPKATLMPPFSGICSAMDTIYFTVIDTTSGNTYSWAPNSTNSGLSCTNCPNPEAYPTNFTVYTVTVTGANGCSIFLHDTVGGITAHITGKDTICKASSDTLIASGGSSNNSTYIWNTGSTNSSITIAPPTTTTFSVQITDGSCNASTSFTIVIDSTCPLGIHEISEQPEISIYPNPTNSFLTVKVEQPIGESTSLSIIDITGRELIYQKTNPSQSQLNIDVSSLAPSIYFLKLQTDEGIVVKKFVKE